MKTKVMILIGAMLVSIMGVAQVEFKNTSTADIKVSAINGLNTVVIEAKKSGNVPFLNETAGIVTAKIQHYAYQPGGYLWIDDDEMTFAVKNGQAIFSRPNQKQAVSSSLSSSSEKQVKAQKAPFQKETQKTQSIAEKKTPSTPTKNEAEKEVSPFINDEATFVVKNCCTMTITGYSGLFEGLCLKPEQSTKVRVSASTGTIQSAIGYDTDPDKTATGANQKWAVLYKSIPEKLDTLKIYNENLVLVNTGTQIIKPFRNQTPLGYLITNSQSQGTTQKTDNVSDKTVAPNSVRKMKFYLGWNVLAFQYLDENGLPRQAVLLFMVTKDQKSVTLTKKSGSGSSISDKDLKIE